MISFGDKVRVRVTPQTEQASLAGLEGQVYGETTPSVTGVDVIGEPESDFAINVHFEARGDSLWFTPDLLELIDHAAGTEIRLKGVDKKWTRTPDGGWLEEPTSDDAPDSTARSKPWWKFW